ncbi:serine hydrolase [Enterococcus sp. BWM-S5]|uniref:Serine hydrolase n=1 Tax=Enterococcus larvae TaxID=2794352 RepID=A0ABS4CLY2_9ENTE|nr:serine hydrolase [Enterococcus larvae]MBP1047612.1 serine hydrolase [Enterococcus larvae]
MEQGKQTELEQVIKSEYGNTAGLVIMKDGETLYESYFNDCSAESRIHIFSVTKSILSLLIGIAIDRGAIQSVDQKVLDFFPEYEIEEGEKSIQKITIRHLLTMTAPFKFEEEPYVEYFTSEDWAAFALKLLGGKGAVGEFRYRPIVGPDILSSILERAAGVSVLAFAKKHLFLPLGITVDRNITFKSQEEQFAFYEATTINGWVADQMGTNAAGWGLTLSPMDMAKIGQLYLTKGVWKEKQIISPQWLIDSITEHSRWQEMNLAYGYLWWLVDEDCHAAMGDGGNVIYINTKKNLVVASTALFVQDAKDRITFIKEHIEPFVSETV